MKISFHFVWLLSTERGFTGFQGVSGVSRECFSYVDEALAGRVY